MPSIQKQPNVVPMPPKPANTTWTTDVPKASAAQTKPDDDARTFLLQPWITIRGGAIAPNAITTVTQDDAMWCDLGRFADAAFWVDVSGVTALSSGGVFLNIESSPTTDEQDFRPVAPPLQLAPAANATGGVIPLFVKTVRSPSTVPLSRYTRWRLSATGTLGTTWDASFRIRGAGGVRGGPRASGYRPTSRAATFGSAAISASRSTRQTGASATGRISRA